MVNSIGSLLSPHQLGKFKENHITCNDTESQTLKWMQQRDINIIYTKKTLRKLKTLKFSFELDIENF